MEIKIPEKEANEIISAYNGANNYILDLKEKTQSKYYKLGRTQADYVLTHCGTVPKIARKHTPIDPYFAEQLQDFHGAYSVTEENWEIHIDVEENDADGFTTTA